MKEEMYINLFTMRRESHSEVIRRICMKVDKAVAKALRSLEGSWEQSEPKSAGGNVDDGDYTCKLTEMVIGLSKKKRLQVVTSFEIDDGKNEGETIMKFDGIDNDVSMSWFKGYCEVLGLEIPEDIGDLPQAIADYLEENNDTLFTLRLKTKGEYQNIFLQGVLDEEAEEVLDPDADPDYDPEKEADELAEEEAEKEAEKKRKKKARDKAKAKAKNRR